MWGAFGMEIGKVMSLSPVEGTFEMLQERPTSASVVVKREARKADWRVDGDFILK